MEMFFISSAKIQQIFDICKCSGIFLTNRIEFSIELVKKMPVVLINVFISISVLGKYDLHYIRPPILKQNK